MPLPEYSDGGESHDEVPSAQIHLRSAIYLTESRKGTTFYITVSSNWLSKTAQCWHLKAQQSLPWYPLTKLMPPMHLSVNGLHSSRVYLCEPNTSIPLRVLVVHLLRCSLPGGCQPLTPVTPGCEEVDHNWINQDKPAGNEEVDDHFKETPVLKWLPWWKELGLGGVTRKAGTCRTQKAGPS
jgi:hypothetical protein